MIFMTLWFASCKRAEEAGRLDDAEYLTRIIFCDMVKDNIDGTTGFGIGKEEHGDIEYLVTVYPDRVVEQHGRTKIKVTSFKKETK